MENNIEIPRIILPDGTAVPAVGQGTWNIGDSRAHVTSELSTLREGIDLGMSLIDTAEMYGNGASERLVGEAISGQRDRVFLVSKVYPHNASKLGVAKSCAASLKRLRTDYLDLYLLHWRGDYPLSETVEAFERLRAIGQIRYWGVSNFDTRDMMELGALPAGGRCATNQVLYHPEERGIEFSLLPWCQAHSMPVMAYSPLGQGGRLLRSQALTTVARRHGATPGQIALAWCLRSGGVIAIPKASTVTHVRENAGAAAIKLTIEDLAEIEAAHTPPSFEAPLAML